MCVYNLEKYFFSSLPDVCTCMLFHSHFPRFANRKNARALRKSGGVSDDVIVNVTDDTTGKRKRAPCKEIDDGGGGGGEIERHRSSNAGA